MAAELINHGTIVIGVYMKEKKRSYHRTINKYNPSNKPKMHKSKYNRIWRFQHSWQMEHKAYRKENKAKMRINKLTNSNQNTEGKK